MNTRTAMQVWQSKCEQALKVANDLVDCLPLLKRLYLANALADVVKATEPGAVVEGGGMTKERIEALALMFTAFDTWIVTPLYKDGPTPLMLVSMVD